MEEETDMQFLERGISILDRIRKKFPNWSKIPPCIEVLHRNLHAHITNNHIEEISEIDKFLVIEVLFMYVRTHSRKEIMEIIDVIFEKEN